MIDWEDVMKAEGEEQLREAKLWLFQENIRVQEEKKEFEQARERFLNERVKFKKEMEELNHRTVVERKRLKEDNLFFDKKMAILQDGFRRLEEDKRIFEREKKAFEMQRKNISSYEDSMESCPQIEALVKLMFRGINNPLALRKRYKDLVKIFHPDNLCGDGELARLINKEYICRKREE